MLLNIRQLSDGLREDAESVAAHIQSGQLLQPGDRLREGAELVEAQIQSRQP